MFMKQTSIPHLIGISNKVVVVTIHNPQRNAKIAALLGGSRLGVSTLLLRGGRSSHRRTLRLFTARFRGGLWSCGGGSGARLGELEEAAADLLGVRLEDLDPVLQ